MNPTVPCKYCKTPTPLTDNPLCDPCWQLHASIQGAHDSVLAAALADVRPSFVRGGARQAELSDDWSDNVRAIARRGRGDQRLRDLLASIGASATEIAASVQREIGGGS